MSSAENELPSDTVAEHFSSDAFSSSDIENKTDKTLMHTAKQGITLQHSATHSSDAGDEAPIPASVGPAHVQGREGLMRLEVSSSVPEHGTETEGDRGWGGARQGEEGGGGDRDESVLNASSFEEKSAIVVGLGEVDVSSCAAHVSSWAADAAAVSDDDNAVSDDDDAVSDDDDAVSDDDAVLDHTATYCNTVQRGAALSSGDKVLIDDDVSRWAAHDVSTWAAQVRQLLPLCVLPVRFSVLPMCCNEVSVCCSVLSLYCNVLPVCCSVLPVWRSVVQCDAVS